MLNPKWEGRQTKPNLCSAARANPMGISLLSEQEQEYRMEYLDEDRLKLLLRKEWMVKNDNTKSIPYLLKFYASTVDQCCCVMITDTKQVWGEVLPSKLLARRWRDCNPHTSPPLTQPEEDEDEWRSQTLELLSAAHSLGGVIDLTFDVVESKNADFAFELGSDEFKWRWETYYLGPRVSADVLSQHLIMPLISVTHLAFSSADPVSELSEADLEKAVDKVGRTARRSVDTHVRHAMTKPRVATTLRRMAAVFNFIPEMPAILNDVQAPALKLPAATSSSRIASKAPEAPAPSANNISHNKPSSILDDEPPAKAATPKRAATPPTKEVNEDDSATEAESDEEPPPPPRSAVSESNRPVASPRPEASGSSHASRSRLSSPKPQAGPSAPAAVNESSDTSPVRPAKKSKRVESSSSDEDSEAERKRRLAQRKSASASRGAKQPVKRGGRRF